MSLHHRSVGFLGVPVIGIVGAAGAGKDTIAQYLAEQYDAIAYSSGDPIREVMMLYYLSGLDDERKYWSVYTHAGKASVHPYLKGWFYKLPDGYGEQFISFEHETCELRYREGVYLRSLTVREVMEIVGDKMCAVDPYVLMRPMLDRHRETGATIIDTSTREEKQAEFVRSNGGVIIYCRNTAAEAKAGAHHSATFYLRTGHDFRVENNGAFDELYHQLDEVVTRIRLRVAA
jgi:hypothetical protein